MIQGVTAVIDAGGTYLKTTLVSDNGDIVNGSANQVPSYSDADSQTILDNFYNTVSSLFCQKGENYRITGMIVSVPGPFDYDTGTSLMDHKYRAIKGISLHEFLSSRIPQLKKIPLQFCHDLHAFAYGEYLYGSAKGFRRILCVSIGTGVGAGCIIDGKPVTNETGGPVYSVYRRLYKGAPLENVVSAAGIVKLYQKIANNGEETNPKKIQIQAELRRDKAAIQTYKEVGKALGKVIAPILTEIRADCLILGGQISRAYPLFELELTAEIKSKYQLIKIGQSNHVADISLRGAAELFD